MTQLKTNLLKKGKKGFTLTELAIVIAVIAILIAVLVPTFTSVITNAKVTAAAENAHSSITAYTLETYDDLDDTCVIESNGYYFKVTSGAIDTSNLADDIDNMIAYTWQDSSNTSLPTIYVTTDYLAKHLNQGFAATAATAAAKAADTTYAGTYVYATVKDSSTTYYFSLSGTTAASSVTYVATADTTDNTSSHSSQSATFTPIYSGYTITLYA